MVQVPLGAWDQNFRRTDQQFVLPLPWYPFGYGLSYSEFEYGEVTLDKTTVSVADTVTVSVDVTNTHRRLDGTEVVQVYVVDDISSVAVPNRLLKGFEKVVIRAGETKTVNIQLKVVTWGCGIAG
jgi:beta-glucosidase